MPRTVRRVVRRGGARYVLCGPPPAARARRPPLESPPAASRQRWAVVCACAALTCAAFLAGRVTPVPTQPPDTIAHAGFAQRYGIDDLARTLR